MFIQKKHQVARAAREILGMKLFFFSPSFSGKNEGGGSLPPASNGVCHLLQCQRGPHCIHSLSPLLATSYHSAHPSGLSVSALRGDISFNRTDKARHCHDTFPDFPALLQSIGHSPVIPRGKSEPLSGQPLYKPPPSSPAGRNSITIS